MVMTNYKHVTSASMTTLPKILVKISAFSVMPRSLHPCLHVSLAAHGGLLKSFIQALRFELLDLCRDQIFTKSTSAKN